jgi:hypothetical protein
LSGTTGWGWTLGGLQVALWYAPTGFTDADWSGEFQIPGACESYQVYVTAVDKNGNLYVAGRGMSQVGSTLVNGIAEWNGHGWLTLAMGVTIDMGAYIGDVETMACDNYGNLYAGGYFTAAGGVSVNNIAKWDGSTWSALGSGLGGWVYSLVCDNVGNLYACGTFTNAGSLNITNIAKWNGNAWSALGLGIGAGDPNSFINSLACDNFGNIYAGGTFTNAGGVMASNVAKWNGSAWSALGSGISGSQYGTGVTSLACDSSGILYVSGSFSTAGGVAANNIAKWNGSAWSALGSGFGGEYANSLVCDNSGNLYAGGWFTTAGEVSANYIAEWNGSVWSALGSGASVSFDGVNLDVTSLSCDSSGNLYVGGDFSYAGGLRVNSVAKWNGNAWSAIGQGCGDVYGGDYSVTEALARDISGNIYAGGDFATDGGVTVNGIAEWNGTTWTPLSSGVGGYEEPWVAAIAFDSSGNLYAGGCFTTAGGIPANNIAEWNGTTWLALGAGVSGEGIYTSVKALAFDSVGNLYAGGDFTNAGGVSANFIAKWNGSVWTSLGSGLIGQGFAYNGVNALVFDISGNLYAGGNFTNAGGVPANNIAKWNGNTWSTLGAGISGVPLYSEVNTEVNTLVFDSSGNLYVGGYFTNAGGVPANNIAKWNGNTWSPLWSGMNGTVSSLAFDNSGDLYATGAFTTAGGVPANGIAKWNGSAWIALGSGIGGSVNVPSGYSLAFDRSGNLYVGGGFTTAGTNGASDFTEALLTNVQIQTGSLQVIITPSTAITNGAHWQVDGGTLQSSGTTISGLAPGTHVLTFSTISGWVTPSGQTVAVSTNSTATACGNYVAIPQVGSLQVTIIPTAAVASGAQWQVDGGTLQNSGATVSNLSVGGHNVCFSTISSWTAPPCQTVTITSNSIATATGAYVTNYTLIVSASPANGGIVSSGGTFASNTTITVTATNNSGYVFTGWTSNGIPAVSTTNYTFTLRTNITLVANFLPCFTVMVSASPANGGTVNGGGTFASNSTITVTATNNSGYAFTGWTSNGLPAASTTNYTFTLRTNVTLVANFLPRFTVAVSASPANGGTVNGGGTFASNSTVTVTATASPGYVFTNWMQGTNVAATSTNYSFVLTSNATLLANFVATPPHIVLLNGTNVITNGETSPVNFGSVQLNRTGPIVTFVVTNTGGQTLNLEDIEVPAGYTLNTNYPAEIAALSNGTFSVQLVTTNVGVYCGNIDITNNDPITNTFSFSVTGMVTPVPSATVSVIASPADGGTASAGGTNGGGVFPVGTTNAVLATPNSGFEFIGWTGNATGTENPLMVTVNTNLNITANFAIITNFTLTVITNGEGTVSPNPNGRFFKANSTHILTATAASGYVFSNWTGSIATNKNPLTIKLESSIVLQANFTPNPFLPVTGTYNGLFSATNGVTEQTAGMLRGLTISKKGAYTGTLLINGGSHPISGAFNLDGQATNRISRTTAQGGLLTVVLSLTDGPPPQVTGTVSNAAWVSTNLIADRATNNPGALPSTEYTMLIPPDTKTAPTNSPGGYGYALITNHVGTVKITGALADGTAFSQSVPVSLDGYVPVYANLYSSKGLLLGWINLDLTNNDGVGLTWVHPETRSGLYVKGFTNILLTNQILLSPWTNSSTNIFAATNLSILDTINDTNALMDFTVTISNDYKLGEVAGPAPLSGCCINPKTGLLKVTIGSGVNQMTGYGAFLLNETNGCGYFLGKSNAGAVILDP